MPSVASRFASPDGPFERPSRSRDAGGRAPVVLMVSGGADSTALLLLAATSELDIADGRGTARIARERLYVLHVNHQLRGDEADADEEFVFDLAASHGIPCEAVRVDVAARARQAHNGNVENEGRQARYQAANDLANRLSEEWGTPRSAARILTAHTADDRAETFLMNAVRGSGASGLSSIPRRRNRVVRPLLDRTHAELCDYLRMRGQSWREDPTNADTQQLRSWVRHELLPVAKQRNPRVVDAIATSCELLSDEDAYLTQVAARRLRDLMRRSSEGMVALDAGRLSATELAVARRVVRAALLQVEPDARLEARHVDGVLQLVADAAGSLTTPMGVDARVEHGLLFLRARRAKGGPRAAWFEVPGTLELGGGHSLRARVIELPHDCDPQVFARERAARTGRMSVLADAESVLPGGTGRLWVDGPQPGDVLCPFGMHGQSKKLSDLLNDEAIPAAEKPHVAVVRTSMRGRIVWVAGIRLDERARVRPTSRSILELTLR